MRKIEHIVLHCSATRPVQDIGVAEIRKWHKAQGWADIGYHYVIRRNGVLELGRPLAKAGAHVAGHNARTIGVCLVGGIANAAPWRPEDNFTAPQWKTLRALCESLHRDYPNATILGHRDFPGVAKACPCFDARKWARSVGLPAAPQARKNRV